MRYLILLTLILAAWMLIHEFIFKDRGDEGLETYGEKVRDLGHRLHVVFGVLAVLIFVIYVVRIIVRAYWTH
jgi:hypothetical protein